MDFAREFMTKLDGKVSEEDMQIILRELEVFSGDYDIQKKGNRNCRVSGTGTAGMLQSVSDLQKDRGAEQGDVKNLRPVSAGFSADCQEADQRDHSQ